MRRFSADWKLAGGFSALLFLIVAIGLVGISRIESLGKTVDDLGGRYFPMQQAALEMRVSNSLYAMSIRNYVFWRSARYLEAARSAASKEAINTSILAFDRQLSRYTALAKETYGRTQKQELLLEKIKTHQQELCAIGDKIVELVDQIPDVKAAEKNGLEDSVNKLLMTFESKLYIIDRFLDGSVQKANLEAVRTQLYQAESDRKRAITLLLWSLLLALAIGGETAFLVYHNRRRERERREELVRKMIKIEEEDRKSLSLQVHDQMGQDLSGLRIYLDLINSSIPDDKQEAKKCVREGKRVLSGLIDKSHNIAELLRPPALEEIGLIDTIESLVFQYKQLGQMHITYQKPSQARKLSDEYSLLLYRVAQEGLTNILNHANAKNVEIKLDWEGSFVRLSMHDDGVGFSYDDVTNVPHRRRDDRMKLGLLGLRERVELLNGRLEIQSERERGTLLTVQLPLTKP